MKVFKIMVCLFVFFLACNNSDPNVTRIDISKVELPHSDWSLVFNDRFEQIGIVGYNLEFDNVLVFLQGCEVRSIMPFSYQYLESEEVHYLEYSKQDYMKLKDCKELKLELWKVRNKKEVTNI